MKPAYSGTILLHFLDDGAINVFDLKRGRCGPKRPASSETSSTQSTVGWFPLLEPVAALGVHQLVSHAGEGGNFRWCASFFQGLAHQIHDGRQGAQAVVLLDMELEGFFVHAWIVPRRG
jgi:hypothetical protein